jgi:hypothetical protein
MPGSRVTRAELRRALVLNALAQPVNVLVPAGVLVAAAIFGAAWLAIVAVVCWLVLVGLTFFDEREAARVGDRVRAARRDPAPAPASGVLAPEIRTRVRSAAAACAAIRDAIAASPAMLDDVRREVDALLAAIHADAERAQRIHAFLREEPPSELERRIAGEPRDAVREALQGKLAALGRLRGRLDGLLAEMDHVVAVLQTLQAEILSTAGTERALEERALASQVSELRVKVRIMSTGLEESFAETRVRQV